MRLPKRNRIDQSKKLKIKHKYTQKHSFLKPNGVWYSCYNSWYSWTKREMPNWLYKYIHEINFNKNILTDIDNKNKDKVLVLNKIRDIELFHKRYYNPNDKDFIDWTKVTKDYGGIEFSRHFSEIRQKYPWYYSLDAASGCVWNTKNIIKDTGLIYEKKQDDYIKIL